MSSLEFFSELLSYIPDRLIYRVGRLILRTCGMINPDQHGTWCVAVGFLSWLLIFAASLAFLLWFF